MPTYALLGATGATGSAILRSLLQHPPPDLRLNILVRNKRKLLNAFPGLEATPSFTIQIFEGTATELPAMRQCLAHADAIFVCIASNFSKPGETLFQDTAGVVIDALLSLRDEEPAPSTPSPRPVPTVLVLRSGHLNPIFETATPWLVRQLLWFCLYYLYSDMVAAGTLYDARARENPGLLEVTYLDPPAMHDGDAVVPATGYELMVHRDGRKAPSANLSYADLGAAFVEVAGRRAEFAGKGVVVSATGAVHLTWGVNVAALRAGVVGRVLGWFGIKR